jgi:hypothetical protein
VEKRGGEAEEKREKTEEAHLPPVKKERDTQTPCD